jgi:hypothetical protein
MLILAEVETLLAKGANAAMDANNEMKTAQDSIFLEVLKLITTCDDLSLKQNPSLYPGRILRSCPI